MATRFYFHDATTSDTGTLPGATTLSATSPSQTVTGASTNRVMDTSLGAAQVSVALTTLANTSAQPSWFRRFVSSPIAAQSIDTAQTFTLGIAASESSTNSNFFPGPACFLWRPSGGGSTIATLFEIAEPTVEAGAAETFMTGTLAASGTVTSQDGDVLVVELWRDASAQSMATAYTNTIWYDGTTDGSSSNAASYLDFANTITMSGGAAAPVYAEQQPLGRSAMAFFSGAAMAILKPQEWGAGGAAPVFYAAPTAAATAGGFVPVMIDTHAAPIGAATGAANPPVMLDSHQTPIATVTGQANAPVVQAAYAPAVVTATTAANPPTMLVSYGVPVVTAAAAALIPFLETTQDAYERPLAPLMGLATIPGSMAILQPQALGADAAPASVYAVPVAAATAAANAPVVLDTHAPPTATVAASAVVPAMLATYQPAVTATTGAANLPAVLSTHAPAATTATANAVSPAMLVTYQPAVAAAVASAFSPALLIPSAEFEYPLALAGGLPTILGSMAILSPQEIGVDPLAVTVYSVPVATAIAAANSPAELATWQPAAAATTGQANTPSLLETYLAVIASATAAANTPVVVSTYAATIASATGSAPTPALIVTFDQIPAALATAGAYTPAIIVTQDEYERPLVFLAGIPRIPGSMAILQPQSLGEYGAQKSFLAPVAAASAGALTPALLATYLAAATTASSAASAPAMLGTLAANPATATAGALIPALLATFSAPASTATALAPAPLIRVTFAAPLTTALTAALVPLISGLTFGGTSTTRTHATGASGLAVVAGVIGRSRGTGVTGSTLGALLGSRTHATGQDGSTDV